MGFNSRQLVLAVDREKGFDYNPCAIFFTKPDSKSSGILSRSDSRLGDPWRIPRWRLQTVS
jgi:hypothetical protein